ncbi:aspartate kinase [Candidatus Epulonipiscium fishelsonii]|uniref:Aspartate kinase n=1 Tax=Candidatus Epulonipiscium fishelsonii TaxID=77094 RepID=A0ACC8XGR3_9FIRM|nr:aspartate kinase [Epulopiscium sp. SCG-D08WGA-EpuloA1]OON97034.1 MAG: aspartate kinase [Epulopiscium sp. AS2M-Bin002]
MLIVQKYGGSSVANTERIFNVANRITEYYKQGHDVVVVLSAQGDTTDNLIEKVKEISKSPSKREMDMILSTGEQQSVALMAIALTEMGYPCISLNAAQVGMFTTSDYGNARIKKIKTERMKRELERKNIVLVTGFQGINNFDDITTLGRGGSDTTAVAIAAALHADKCEIYTDVEGVYTADPRVVENAKKIKEITYHEMLELASLGAKVLHNRSVELAKKYNVELIVRSSLTKAEGTIVKGGFNMEKMSVIGIAGDDKVARIALIGIEDKPGKAFEVFNALAKENINVDLIIQSIGHDAKRDISFTVDTAALEDTQKIINSNKERWGVRLVDFEQNLAKVSIVGAGMATDAGVASSMFEAMFDANINIHMISTSDIKISILVNKTDMKKAMCALHDKFALQY